MLVNRRWVESYVSAEDMGGILLVAEDMGGISLVAEDMGGVLC